MIPNFKMGYYHQKDNIRPCQVSENVRKPMGFDYTSLISTKTYSILSYIVGGFVGSKSQMNNDKHLSYDLSAVIFNLLHPQKTAKIPKENNYCSRLNYEKYYQKTIIKEQAVDLAFSLFGQFDFDEYCDKLSLSQSRLGVTKTEDVTDRVALESTCMNSLVARFRQRSESSVESTDSESFIVFDDQDDEKKGEWPEVEFVSDDETDDDDDEDDETDDDDNDDDSSDCSCDEYELYSAEKELAQANSKWSKNYEDVVQGNECPKKVRFSDDVKVKKIVAWEYAYRAARPGPWEQMARDRVRFQERILRLSSVISPVLERGHREKIYKELYS